MSQDSSCHMGPKSSLTHSIPSDLIGNNPWGYGGTIPEHIIGQQCYNNTNRKKSNVRLNDQLIPKPTDIYLADKLTKNTTPKEHPYSSHISRFAMFPSFRSPDDPETGVRAASQPFLNLHIPKSAPHVTLLSKTIGAPYRHEILASPVKSLEKAVTWTGQHGDMDGEKQGFYPTPPKSVLPNPKLRDWDLSLSERTSNMLKNMERKCWLTSYQMHYTGSGPANPLKMDDFGEKMRNLSGIDSRKAPLLERSYPVFVPSKPNQGCGRRQGSSCSAELPKTNPALDQSFVSATVKQPQEITAMYNEAPDPDPMHHSQSGYSTGLAEAEPTDLPLGILHKQATHGKSPVHKARGREKRKVQFDESLVEKSVSQRSHEGNAAQVLNTERPLDMYNRPQSQGGLRSNKEKSLIQLCSEGKPSRKQEYFKSGRNLPQSTVAKDQTTIAPSELLSRACSEQEGLAEGKEPLHSISNPCILARPAVLPGIHSADRGGTVWGAGAAVTLADLQNSFSKSDAHRNFNSSVTCAAVDLRDNVLSGKKHNFYGINCNYIHG